MQRDLQAPCNFTTQVLTPHRRPPRLLILKSATWQIKSFIPGCLLAAQVSFWVLSLPVLCCQIGGCQVRTQPGLRAWALPSHSHRSWFLWVLSSTECGQVSTSCQLRPQLPPCRLHLLTRRCCDFWGTASVPLRGWCCALSLTHRFLCTCVFLHPCCSIS